MTAPDADRIFAALDRTWPAAEFLAKGPWTLRKGEGGGQRVSAATANQPVGEQDVLVAEEGMRGLGQRPLFMIRHQDDTLDRLLKTRGYDIVDPVAIYLSPVDTLVRELPLTAATPSWPPLAVQGEIWDTAGIGPARQAIMHRAPSPKTSMLGRTGDVPSGTAFVSVDGDIAMLHALEVAKDARRKGVGRAIMQGCANWVQLQGATWMTLAVTRANAAANALYLDLGMKEVAAYHYRRAPEGME
ncbi:MAG: GNAT family N-acetyltransferase [Paracoccaceae bacterium]|nr:GNAT family N-acetyltransferase [Paracoccaceae bacterium]